MALFLPSQDLQSAIRAAFSDLKTKVDDASDDMEMQRDVDMEVDTCTSVDDEVAGSDHWNEQTMIEENTLDEMRELLITEAQGMAGSSLKERLTAMWTMYIQHSNSISVSDFLSVRHLGYILQQLSEIG